MKKKIYFKNFDALRAIAALVVLIAHIELQKNKHGLEVFSSLNLIPLGGIAVTLFFTLSGFLITYLLINEHQTHQKINIGYFYLRRIFKIWPLYFLLLLIGFVFYRDSISVASWVYSIFFLPNVAFMNGGLPELIDPIWSIGIEEQFYLFFPLLFLIKSLRKVFLSIVLLLIALLFLKFGAILFKVNVLRDYLYFARFDAMLLGAITAFGFHFYQKEIPLYQNLFKVIYSKGFQMLMYLVVFAYIALHLIYQIKLIHQLLAVGFCLLLLNLGTNPKSILNLEFKLFKQIGIVSYGLYLTHKFVNDLVLTYVNVDSFYLQNLLIYLISIGLSILLALLLYYGFEIFFIRQKKKFSIFLKKNE